MGGFEFCRGQRPSPPRVAAPAKYYFAARIVHEKEKPFRGKALEDGPALGRQRANSPNQSERFEEADFLRSHGPDCRVDLVFGRADQDAVKLAELIYLRKLVQARARGRHSRLLDRQIDAQCESQQAEAQDAQAPFPGSDAEKPA